MAKQRKHRRCFSDRDRAIIRLFALGLYAPEVSRRLGISQRICYEVRASVQGQEMLCRLRDAMDKACINAGVIAPFLDVSAPTQDVSKPTAGDVS